MHCNDNSTRPIPATVIASSQVPQQLPLQPFSSARKRPCSYPSHPQVSLLAKRVSQHPQQMISWRTQVWVQAMHSGFHSAQDWLHLTMVVLGMVPFRPAAQSLLTRLLFAPHSYFPSFSSASLSYPSPTVGCLCNPRLVEQHYNTHELNQK